MKRLISLVLSAVLILGMLPVGAFPALKASAAESVTYTYVQQKMASLAASDTGTVGAWYINGSTFITDEGSANYIEIVEDGCKDAGAMHVYQDNVANNNMSLGMFVGGQAAGTYTLKLSVKGDLGLSGQTCKFYPYGCADQAANLHDTLGTTDVADWTEVTIENITVASTFYYLIFSFSKYNWQTDMYIDNVQLINSSGADVLAGAGSFYALEEVSADSATTGQWPVTMDTAKVSESNSAYRGEWTPFCHYTAEQGLWHGTWPAWDPTIADSNYGEIIADGYRDAGSLHLKSAASRNTGVAIDAGMVSGETYTLGLWIKGTASSNKILGLYGNGDGTVIGNPIYCADAAVSTVPGNWTYLEKSFTADRSNLILVANDWGVADLYIDNITLTDRNGNDLLAGCGDFYYSTEGLLTLDTDTMASAYDAPNGQWSVMYPAGAPDEKTWSAWDDTHYGEIVVSGYRDQGALHLVSAPSKNAGVAIGVDMTKGESYTLGLWAKGTSNSGKVLFSYANGDPAIIGASNELSADWSYYEITLTCSTTQLNIVASDWGSTDIYIDNITLRSSDGVDLLEGLGNFCIKEESDEPEDPQITGSKLYQKSALFSGDSISWGVDRRAWASRIGEKYSMNYVNASVSGASVSTCRDTNRMLAQLETYKNRTFDYVILHGGTNDAWDAAPLGEMTNSFQPADFDTDTFAGGLEELFYYCRQYFEDARMGFIINFRFKSDIGYGKMGDMSEYVAVTKAICNKWQIPYLDLYNNAELTAALKVDTTEYLPDGVHPNAAGYEIITPYIADWMNQVVAEQIVLREPTEEGWIAAADYTQLQLGTDYDYSFAVLGDIQHVTDYTPDDLHYLFDYILDNKDARNIQFVFGMGDSTNDLHNEANNLVEWQLVQDQFFRFNGVLPYTVIRGNHDNVSRMNAYLADPAKTGYTDQLDGVYQEGSVVNAWKEFSVGGVDYLNIIINYESSDSVLQWASEVIEAHPNHRVIVGTHVYMQEDGSYDNEMNPGFGDAGIVNNAQQVWDKLISRHENIFMVLCGHNSSDDVLVQHKTGVNGNQITEIRVDSQYTDLVYMNKDGELRSGTENGVGMVTMLYFKNDGTQVAVEHYSVLRGWYRQLQTFQIEPYEHYGWRYDDSEQDSYNVDVYAPATGLADAPAILQSGLGEYTLHELLKQSQSGYSGTGVSILPDYNMDLGTHTYALHSGTQTVDPSGTYTISYKIRGLSENTRMWPQIHFCRSALGGSDTWESQWQEPCLQTGPIDDWQEVSFDIYTDGTTSAIEIYFIANGGEVYIDDFSIVKKPTPADRNMLPNGDFETVASGVPSGWYASSSSVGTVAAAEEEGVDGSTGLQVTQTTDGCTTVKLTGGDSTLSLDAGAEYILTYSFKAEQTGTQLQAMLREKASDADAELGGYRYFTKVSGTAGQWVTQTESFTTSADHAGCNLWLNAYGSMVIDNVTLVKVGGEDTDSTYGVNIVTNGDFELGNDGEYPTGFYTMKTGGIGTVEKVSGAGVDGSAAVRIEPRPGYILKNEEAVTAAANTEYTLSYMVRIPGKTTELTPVIRLYDSNGTVTALTGTEAEVSGVTDWKQVTYGFTTAADTAAIQICLLTYGGQADVDNISLTAADGSELLVNGSFASGLEGFAGEFVQGLQEGTVISVSSARSDSLIVAARTEDGCLNAYDADALLGTVDWLYGELEHRVNFGLRIADADTAAAVAAWVTQRHVENLWVIADSPALLDTVLEANENVKAVLDCTADTGLAENCQYAYALVTASADISKLQADGMGVIVVSDTVTEDLLKSGADGILTADSLAAIGTLEKIPMAEDAAQVAQWSLSLGDQIGVNFYLQIAQEQASNAVVNITVGEELTVIPVSSLTAQNGLYCVCAKVAAAQMTEDILLTVVTDGVLAENSTYTVRQYAEHILNEANGYDAATRALVKEMLGYGAAAQSYFAYNTDDLADAGLSGAGAAEVPGDADTQMVLSGSVSGVQYYGASLVFDSKTVLRLYFSGDASDCAFTANGEALTVTEKGGLCYVEVDGITPDQLDKAVTVTVTKGDEVMSVGYSPMSYIVRMYARTASSDGLKSLLKAMYNYHLAAKSYITGL